MSLSDPTVEEIEEAASALLKGTWEGMFPHEVSEVTWISPEWQAPDPIQARLYSFWLEEKAKNSEDLFYKDQLDPLAIRSVLKNIMLLDQLEEGFDAIYRVYGTEIVNFAKMDWTGKRVSDMNETTKVGCALLFRGCYRAMYLSGKPLFTHHMAPTWSRAMGWKRLLLPIHDRETKELCRFVVANIPVAERDKEVSHLYRSSRL